GKAPWRRVLRGDDAKRVAELEKQIQALEDAGKFAEAQAPAKEIVKVRTRVQGADHWQTADARLVVQTQQWIAGQSPALQQEMAAVGKLAAEANQLYQQGRHGQAEPLLRKILVIQRQVLGEEHADTARSYNNLAANLNAQGQYAAAEPLYRTALAIRR